MKDRQGDLFIASEIEFNEEDDEILDEIRDYDIYNSTPVDALNFIIELKKRLSE